MRARSVAALAGMACALGVCAAPAVPDTAASAPSSDARSWLGRIHDAASRRSFQGTFVVSAAGLQSSTRIVHFCEGNNRFERIDSLDGQMRRVVRRNDTVHTLWPASRVVSVEQRDPISSFPELLQGGSRDLRIGEHYSVQRLGVDRVAGYEATVLQVQPADDQRFGYRLWAERDSALLLRAEVRSAKDEVIESAAFTDVAINVKVQPEAVLQPLRKLDGWRVVRPAVARTRLEAEGWKMAVHVPGFEQIGCFKRAGDATGDDASGQMLQSVWSDGLAYVSVFIEPFDAARHTKPMQTAIGATHTLMHRQGDWWVTVMGEVPAPTLRRFAEALERQR
jgi:sigma-E factor negative regulatory protein RseB